MVEILIPVPPWAVESWELITSNFHASSQLVSESITSGWALLQHQQNAWWLFVSVVVFWPVWVYSAVALTTAWTWIFWLLASVLIGVLQVIYVTYQFIMIALNVTVLTFLKTYQTLMRSRLSSFLFFFSKQIRRSRQRTSRRWAWKNKIENGKTYADFLDVKVLEPKGQTTTEELLLSLSKLSPRKGSANKQEFRRSRSFAALNTLHEERESPAATLTGPGLTRIGSFDRRTSNLDRKAMESIEVDEDETDELIVQDLGRMTFDLLVSTISRLKDARRLFMSNGDPSLKFLLSGVVKRNHLTLEDLLVNNARSVAGSGQHEFSAASRKLIATYYDEVSKGLDCMAEATIPGDAPLIELGERMTLVRKMKQNTGRTALMLSGGGAQAMYHLGTIRALIDANLYDDIKVISGTSGGSISAACCALMTSKELFEDVCIPTVSTDFRHNGEMKKKNIRWFPPVMDMGAYWLKTKLLVDTKLFRRTCDFYYRDTTFAEAFERTGKHVCITVSASRARGGTAQRLLLNHISTPHVTLASAVVASCALPGVMAPAKLECKNSCGQLEPFEVDGVEWIDGSVQADLPFQRISTLFNVSNYVVAQTNFHVLPFLNKAHHPNTRSLYWRIFQTFEWDIRNRALKLSRLGLFPKLFGQDISKVFKQKYHGNLTLVPRFTAMQTFGLKALVNPTVKDMEGYLKFGQLAAWPFLGVIRDMVRLEKGLDECLERLKERCQKLHPEVDVYADDDLDSIASSTRGSISMATASDRVVRFGSQERAVEHLRNKLARTEQESASLKRQVKELQAQLGLLPEAVKKQENSEKEMKLEDKEREQVPLPEGGVWNLVRQLNFREK